MKTRMERYYQNYQADSNNQKTIDSNLKRSIQNQDLYEEVVNIDPYMEENKIDLNKLEALIKEQEKPKKDYRDLLKINERIEEDLTELEKDLDKTFDINKIINRVKEQNESNLQNNLDSTQYNILNQVEIEAELTQPIDTVTNPEDTLQELFHTITNNSLLTKDMATKELALNVLSDLKPTNEEQEVIPGVKDETLDTAPFSVENIKPLKEIMANKQDEYEQTLGEQARDFFTGNVDFKDEDFEDFSDLENAMKSSNRLIWLLVMLLIIVLAAVGFYVYTNLL